YVASRTTQPRWLNRVSRAVVWPIECGLGPSGRIDAASAEKRVTKQVRAAENEISVIAVLAAYTRIQIQAAFGCDDPAQSPTSDKMVYKAAQVIAQRLARAEG